MIKKRIRYAEIADFRKGPRRLWAEWNANRERNGWLPLKDDEVALLISMTGDQITFVLPTVELQNALLALGSTRIILPGVSWNPDMLKEYAEKIGLDLKGLKRFKEHYAKLCERNRRKK